MIIDLTKPLNPSFVPFASGPYQDPPFNLSEWSSISNEGFRVSRLSMGTQTGTHMDAPAHFVEGGATLEAVAPDDLVGTYFMLDLPAVAQRPSMEASLRAYRREKILFIRSTEGMRAVLSKDLANQILSLPPRVLVLAGTVEVESADPYAFNRLAARAGKFLVEDLDDSAALGLSPEGELFALPLRLCGVAGAPCRVLARI